jgi:hypothetical protein
MVEIEIGVLRTQCINRRIADRDTLEHEVAAWEQQRNQDGARINWMFTTERARAKLARALPPTGQSSLQSTLAALADAEFGFQIDCERLEEWSGPADEKERIVGQLESKRQRQRDLLNPRLDQLQQRATRLMSRGPCSDDEPDALGLTASQGRFSYH